MLVIPSTKLGIGELLAGAGDGFLPSAGKIPSFGFTCSAVWLKLDPDGTNQS